MDKKLLDIQNLIVNTYLKDNKPWFLAYSGGKDSTAVLFLTYNALKTIKNYHKTITIVYCDTGVEIPCVREYVISNLKELKKEIEVSKMPFKIIVSRPEIDKRFFSMVLGKGYVPPTFLFRWCTNRMRIGPMQAIVGKEENIILIGTRRNESKERTKILEKHLIEGSFFKQKNYPLSLLFSPIVDFTTEEIWKCIDFFNIPFSINKEKLKYLYRTNNELLTNSIANGRFGCWICTVVRKDKAGQQLLEKGFVEMEHLMKYRELLIETRNKAENRLPNRKTGVCGKGPYKLTIRKKLLRELLELEKKTKLKLISVEEINYIKKCWKNF